MPFSLIPADSSSSDSITLDRRTWLKTGLAAVGTLALGGSGVGPSIAGKAVASAVNGPGRPWVALVSDTHIDADPAAVARDNNMTNNLTKVVSQILAEPVPPQAVLFDGDLAYGIGRKTDYEQLLRVLKPLTDASLPVHLALGNHDDRGNFREVLGDSGLVEPGRVTAVESHHTVDLTIAGVRFIILDSLQRPNFTPGKVGEAQTAWLADALKSQTDTPTLIFVHHNPTLIPTAGLTDTEAVYQVIVPQSQVKAMVFGHTHVWNPWAQHEGVKLINLPAVAYPFNASQPLGWNKFTPIQGGAQLTLTALDAGHPAHGKTELFNWR